MDVADIAKQIEHLDSDDTVGIQELEAGMTARRFSATSTT